LAVALVALDSRVLLRSAKQERVIAIEDLYSVPENQPERDTVLAEDELIVAIEVPAWRGPSGYLKVRDRASFEFAVVSVAVALRIEAGRVLAARIAAGGVGTRPWRLRDCEFALVGGPAEQDAFRKAARLAGSGAIPLRQNSFKIEILEAAVRRALDDVGTAP
jgi:xanthine dehydrogenase YagS FAD-binding subunit